MDFSNQLLLSEIGRFMYETKLDVVDKKLNLPTRYASLDMYSPND